MGRGGEWRVPFSVGDSATAAVRPEGLRLTSGADRRDGTSDLWAGVVAQFLGDAVEYRFRIGDHVLRARCDRARQFAAGDPAFIELRDNACTVLAD